MNLHPHQIEEMEYRDGPHPASAAYDRDEAQMGAGWQPCEWNKDRPWLLTSRDVWVSNPHYYGPPSPPHPEDDLSDEECESWAAFSDAWWKAEEAGRDHPTLSVFAPAHVDVVDEASIPF